MFANGIFQTSRCTDDIQRAVGVKRNMAQVPCPTRATAQNTSIDHRSATNACAQSQQHNVGGAFSCPEPNLAEQGGLGIVEYRHRLGQIQPSLPIKTLEAF